MRRSNSTETKVSVENDGVKTEETVLLPFQCSQYVLNHVFDVCQEIDKKGGNFNIEKVRAPIVS